MVNCFQNLQKSIGITLRGSLEYDALNNGKISFNFNNIFVILITMAKYLNDNSFYFEISTVLINKKLLS